MDIEKIKLEDKVRDFNWVNKLFEEGKLFLNGTQFSEPIFEKFRLLIKATQEVYEDSWDLEIGAYGEEGLNIIGVVILFKDITIKNSKDKEHPIKDLFVRIKLHISGSNLRIEELHGGRTTISYDEWSSGYMHSHLPSRRPEGTRSNPPYWGSFCRGSGHINDFIAEINSGGGFKEENLTPFLIQILGLVSWESLEGGPHITLDRIKSFPSSGRVFSFNSNATHLHEIKKRLLEQYKVFKRPPDLDFKLESGVYTIIDNEKLEKYILESITLSNQDRICLLSMPALDGRHYAYGQLPGFRVPPIITKKYIFQGQEVSTIIGNPPDLGEISSNNYILNPQVKEFIKQDLEYDINTKKIRKSTIDRYSSKNGNASRGVKPDKMALQGDS